jgi:hypothetical protein
MTNKPQVTIEDFFATSKKYEKGEITEAQLVDWCEANRGIDEMVQSVLDATANFFK